MSKTLDFSKDKELIRQDSAGEYIEVTLNVKKAFGKGRLYKDGSILIERGHYKECVPGVDERFKKTYRSDLGLDIDSEGDIANISVKSLSGAADILIGSLNSGYVVWKDNKGRAVDFYRNTYNENAKATKKRMVAEVLDRKPIRKNIGIKGEPLETLVNPNIKQILGDKVHLEEGDELTWYRDANVKIKWHADGSCDLFEKEHIGICGAVFRILNGHWRGKGEHGVGMEPQHWIYKNIKVSDILKVYHNFWKACKENIEDEDSRSYEMGRTSNKETEAVTKEEVRQPKYYYESARLKYRTTNSDVQCSALRDIDSIRKELFYEGSNSNQDTPWEIAEDMIDLLPESVWNTQTKFLDIYCKSGIFLEVIKNTLKDKCYEQYKELGLTTDKEINKYIFENQIYGLCWSDRNYGYAAESLFMVKCPMNSYNIKKLSEITGSDKDSELVKNEKIRNTDRYIEIKEVVDKLFKEYRGEMKIDVVVGNPPYNKDIYLDFVENGHKIAGQYTLMITPAKWQAKGGEKNEQFRREIVPHMSKIVYYPDCTDVFAIAEAGGVSYYIIDKNEHELIDIVNKCKLQKIYNDSDNRSIRHRETLINKGNIINNNENILKAPKFGLDKTCKSKKYQVWLNNKLAIGGGKSQGTYLFSNEGMMQCLSISRLVDKDGDTSDVVADSQLVFTSDNKNECEYFLSWIYTRFVRFLISINLGGLTGVANPNNDWWRFVPDPGKFDHIFTDAELYAKYNLTDEEIKVIESVIKERK